MSEEIKKQDGCSICGGNVNLPATCAACKTASGSLPDAAPTEWADLSGLEGKELRDRLKSRAAVWVTAAKMMRVQENGSMLSSDSVDFGLIADILYAKELAVTQEAERLWSLHLDSLEHLLDTKEGEAQIVAELGSQYLKVIVDRAAEKRPQPRKPDAFGGVDFDGVPHGNLREGK